MAIKICCYSGRLDQVELNCVERCNQLGNDYRCILICMFACWKKFCYAALTAKTFANFAPFLDPKMEVEKWTQKWCQNLIPKMVLEFDPQNGVQKWHPKGRPNRYYFWTPFWGSILARFLSLFFNLHFGVQKWCKICKSFCCHIGKENVSTDNN